MNIRFQRWCNLLILLVLITSLGIAGCSSQQSNSTESPDNQTTAESPIAPTPTENSNQTMKNYLPRLEGKATVVMTVNGSPITIEVNGNDAPVTAGNFVDLVERGVYDGLVFHRVVKEPQPFVAQGGDPQGKDPKFPVSRLGTGGFVDPKTSQPRYIPLEIKLEGQAEPSYNQGLGQQSGIPNPKVVLKHTRGAIAMARSQAPDSASSQFYFALSDLAFLDGDYAVFGYVTQGMEVVDKIKQGDRLDSAKVVAGSENLKK